MEIFPVFFVRLVTACKAYGKMILPDFKKEVSMLQTGLTGPVHSSPLTEKGENR